MERVYSARDFVRPSDTTPIRSVVLETGDSVIVVWHAKPGQEIPPHYHPHGQDTWTVLSGQASYYLGGGQQTPLKVGDIAVARPGEVHGAFNDGDEEFVFVSVVSSDKAGYESSSR
ncbi:MAG: cupin domain-containing protein [Chromatiales bacterium]|nr:cupin domain-containing protein [Chromatiales bacterium]